MSWTNHIRRPQTVAHREVSAEMRQAIGQWFEEQYGENPGILDFCEIGENFCRTEIMLSDGPRPCDAQTMVELVVHDTGRIEQTLIHRPTGHQTKGNRITLPAGKLPPDNEQFAELVMSETHNTWLKRPIGWHPAHREILEYLGKMAETNGNPFTRILLVAWDADGTELGGTGLTFEPDSKGLRRALTTCRATIKGWQAWDAAFTGERDAGHPTVMLLSTDGPTDEGDMLMISGENLTDINNEIAPLARWENVLPMDE